MQRYEVIRAPFDGIVTARYVDPGALIPQTTTSSGGNPIVALATLSPVRVYADVPQSVAPFIQNGDPAVITVNEYPGREFKGSVTRHPDALANGDAHHAGRGGCCRTTTSRCCPACTPR